MQAIERIISFPTRKLQENDSHSRWWSESNCVEDGNKEKAVAALGLLTGCVILVGSTYTLLRKMVLFAEAAAGTPDPNWDFEPDILTVRKGTIVSVVDQGGEPHTFTEVAKFGGGFVPGLNGPGETVVLPRPRERARRQIAPAARGPSANGAAGQVVAAWHPLCRYCHPVRTSA